MPFPLLIMLKLYDSQQDKKKQMFSNGKIYIYFDNIYRFLSIIVIIIYMCEINRMGVRFYDYR